MVCTILLEGQGEGVGGGSRAGRTKETGRRCGRAVRGRLGGCGARLVKEEDEGGALEPARKPDLTDRD